MSTMKCVLDEKKVCDDCGECDYCDLNPFKYCDNCGKCIGLNEEYRELKIDDMIIGNKSSRSKKVKASGHSHKECCDDDCGCGHHHS